MGQYFKIVNLTKRQYLHPHTFKDGLKINEFAFSSYGVMSALALLLADNKTDLGIEDPKNLIGSWAGDQIVIAGDYGVPGKFCDKDLLEQYSKNINNANKPNVYRILAHTSFVNISADVLAILETNGLNP